MFLESRWKRLSVLGASVLVFFAVGLGAQARTHIKAGESEQASAPPVTDLYPAGTIEFSAPSPMGMAAGTQCDTNGNIYLQIAPSYQVISQLIRERRPLNLSLTKLSTDSKGVTTFPAKSPQGYTDFSSRTFYVTPRGKVFNLGQGCKEGSDCKNPEDRAWMVTAYNDDGTVNNVVELHPQLPADEFLFLSSFAVFPDDGSIVVGETQSKGGGLRPFTAAFGPGGTFLANVKLPHDVSPPPPPQDAADKPDAGAGTAGQAGSGKSPKAAKAFSNFNRAVVEGRTIGSPDGTVYLLRGDRLYIVGSGGGVLREQDIKTPKSGLTPLGVSVNGQGQLVISYTHVVTAEDPGQYSALALVDPETGKVISTYDVPPKAGTPACMTNQDVVQFVRESKSGHLEVAQYTPE